MTRIKKKYDRFVNETGFEIINEKEVEEKYNRVRNVVCRPGEHHDAAWRLQQ